MGNSHMSVQIHIQKSMLMLLLMPDVYRLDGGKPCIVVLVMCLCWRVC